MKFIFAIILFCSQQIFSQEISLLRTFYANDFRDWLFYDEQENELGTLRSRWQLTKDYTQWDIRLGEVSGSILLRWQDHPNDWEIRIHNSFIRAECTWPGQLDSWRITSNNKIYYLNLIPDPEGMQWALDQDQKILAYIYNVYFQDPREWEVKKEVEEVDPELMITAFFLASYYSSPK
jgi:hypothetical protein